MRCSLLAHPQTAHSTVGSERMAGQHYARLTASDPLPRAPILEQSAAPCASNHTPVILIDPPDVYLLCHGSGHGSKIHYMCVCFSIYLHTYLACTCCATALGMGPRYIDTYIIHIRKYIHIDLPGVYLLCDSLGHGSQPDVPRGHTQPHPLDHQPRPTRRQAAPGDLHSIAQVDA